MKYGKFNSVADLQNAYAHLERAFTQKCQQLAELKAKIAQAQTQPNGGEACGKTNKSSGAAKTCDKAGVGKAAKAKGASAKAAKSEKMTSVNVANIANGADLPKLVDRADVAKFASTQGAKPQTNGVADVATVGKQAKTASVGKPNLNAVCETAVGGEHVHSEQLGVGDVAKNANDVNNVNQCDNAINNAAKYEKGVAAALCKSTKQATDFDLCELVDDVADDVANDIADDMADEEYDLPWWMDDNHPVDGMAVNPSVPDAEQTVPTSVAQANALKDNVNSKAISIDEQNKKIFVEPTSADNVTVCNVGGDMCHEQQTNTGGVQNNANPIDVAQTNENTNKEQTSIDIQKDYKSVDKTQNAATEKGVGNSTKCDNDVNDVTQSESDVNNVNQCENGVDVVAKYKKGVSDVPKYDNDVNNVTQCDNAISNAAKYKRNGTSEMSPPSADDTASREAAAVAVPDEKSNGVVSSSATMQAAIRQFVEQNPQFIAELLAKSSASVPVVMTGGGNFQLAAPNRPKTIKEASALAKKLFE